MALEERRTRERARTLRERGRDAVGQLGAARRREGHEGQARKEDGRLRQRQGVRNLAGERQRHRRGQVRVGHRQHIRPRRIDRPMDREIRARPRRAGGDERLRLGSAAREERDADEVRSPQLVLAQPGRRDQERILAQANADVALAGRDQPPRAQPPPGGHDRFAQPLGLETRGRGARRHRP
jgi:hypothetical protein